MHLTPKMATKREGEQELTVPLEHIRPGDILIVKTGEIVPADGVITEGRGVLDEATSSKAPISRIADNVSKIFIPCVIGIALLALIIWLLLDASFAFALSIGISVLVISCPCALGLAAPTAIMVGSGQGALRGILFKSAQALESIQNIDVVVLDKTGTLTTGKPVVTDYLVHTGSVLSLFQFAASLESYSEHPLANAILDESEKQQLPLFPVTQYHVIPGQGISGKIDDLHFFVGNRTLMETQCVEVPLDVLTKAERSQSKEKRRCLLPVPPYYSV